MIAQKDIDDLLGYILPNIRHHVASQSPQSGRRTPFVLALTGLQGRGKTIWTSSFVRTLNEIHKLKTICVSLDDFYLDHDGLIRVREENPSNTRIQAIRCYGLVASTPEDTDTHEVLIPSFDKSKFNGEGDRVSKDEWRRITVSLMSPIDVVVVEGWCVGFQPLDESEIEKKWKEAKHEQIAADGENSQQQFPTRTLQNHELSSYLEINHNLKTYSDIFMGPQHVNFLVHLDTDDLMNVYRWSLEQEHALRRSIGGGMLDDNVIEFIKCYMPAYELYLDSLRHGFFTNLPADEWAQKTHQRVILGRNRRILETITCG